MFLPTLVFTTYVLYNQLILGPQSHKNVHPEYFGKLFKFFSVIRYGASLIAGLASYHDWVGVQVVDDTLENLRNGLELNDTKFNQKRLAVGKFIGELYNYRLIDSSVVFKVLYTLLTYGADANESGYIPLDQPEDMLR